MFDNREEAGMQLAKALAKYSSEHPVVLAIPRGGIIPGVIISQELGAEFSVIITRKLGLPNHPEAAFGAIAEDKSLYLNPLVREMLTKEVIEKVIRKEEKEIQRRISEYRKGHNLPSLKNRTVILVDDGIATGSTIFAAIEMCRKQKAATIIVASPVSGLNTCDKLKTKADEVVILEIPEDYRAVSQAYLDFKNLSDKEVLQWLEASKLPTRETDSTKSYGN